MTAADLVTAENPGVLPPAVVAELTPSIDSGRPFLASARQVEEPVVGRMLSPYQQGEHPMRLHWGRFVVGFTAVGGLLTAVTFAPSVVNTMRLMPGGESTTMQSLTAEWASFAFAAAVIGGLLWSWMGPDE